MGDKCKAVNNPEEDPQIRRDLRGRAHSRQDVRGRDEKTAEDDEPELGPAVGLRPESPRMSGDIYRRCATICPRRRTATLSATSKTSLRLWDTIRTVTPWLDSRLTRSKTMAV